MAHLDKLNISPRVLARRPRRQQTDSVEHRREKLINHLEEQIQLVELARKGSQLALNRRRGASVKTVRPRLWWEIDGEGRTVTQIYYNRRPLKLRGNSSTIETKDLKGLAAAYRTVIRAVKAGELDNAIANAREQARPTSR